MSQQSTAKSTNIRTRAFGEEINHFHNNRDYMFVPITSQGTLYEANRPASTHLPSFDVTPNPKHSASHQKTSEPSTSNPVYLPGDAARFTSVCCIPLRTIDGISATISLILFVLACGFASNEGQYVDLWEQVLIVHNSTEVKMISDAFSAQMGHWCEGLPRIPRLTAYGFPAVPTIINDFEVNLWILNIPIFFTSALFQGYRYIAAKKPIFGFGLYSPANGPDLGRWVEYMLTSPLQVVLVAIAYHIRDESQLISLAFLQATLVFMGYCIEREAYWWQTGHFRLKTEHNALLILVGLSWVVHFIIWIRIIMFRWLSEVQVMDQCSAKTFSPDGGGVGQHTHWTTTTHTSGDVLTVDAYGLTHDASHAGHATHHGNRDVDMDWGSRKVIIDLMFASQFVFFTLFGIVNMLTLWNIRRDVRDRGMGDMHSIQNVWGTATKQYSILSVVVKTLLEIFFFMYVLTNPSGME